MIRWIINFVKKTVSRAWQICIGFFKEAMQNVESVAILSLGAVGATAVISQTMYQFTLPMWIEATMVAPVLGTLGILGLVALMQWRMNLCGASA